MAVNARRLRTRQGFEYEEALSEGLLDPSLTDAERALHASRHATVEAQRRLNPEATNQLTGDKAIFYGYCAAIGLPIPELYGVVNVRGARGGATQGGWSPAPPGSRTSSPTTSPRSRWSSPPTATTARACASCAARGAGFTAAPTPAALLALLRSDPEFSVHVFQERLLNHPVVAEIAGDAPLHTVRIVTLVSREGECEVLYAVIKLGLAGGDTDNFRAGRNGNGLAPVDLATGALGPLKLARPDGCGFVHVPERARHRHPHRGGPPARLGRGPRPVRSAAPSFAPARTLGWDVALTPRGPVVAEVNAFWWPRSGPEQGRLLERLRNA